MSVTLDVESGISLAISLYVLFPFYQHLKEWNDEAMMPAFFGRNDNLRDHSRIWPDYEKWRLFYDWTARWKSCNRNCNFSVNAKTFFSHLDMYLQWYSLSVPFYDTNDELIDTNATRIGLFAHSDTKWVKKFQKNETKDICHAVGKPNSKLKYP